MKISHPHPGASPISGQRAFALALGTGLLALLLLPLTIDAQNPRPTEYQVKAAYLFNFGKFVKWPPSASASSFVICLLGSDPFQGILDKTVAGEQIDNKPVTVRRINSAADAAGCRIVFVSESEEGRMGSILAALNRSPVLTVSDASGFVDHEGMIQFVMDGDRVRFQVNLSAAQRAGLTMSSELLKVATEVKRQEKSGD
jgi:YfiR/HmsC-like